MFEARRRTSAVAVIVVSLQAIAALYFIVDAARESGGALALVDFVIGFALLAGTAFGGVMLRRMLVEAQRREEALAIARGALSELIEARFAEWGLSRSESEVALFALKGCTVAEIATLRGSAAGTVRSQLSQVYSKAEVSGQPMLMSVFLDELVGAVDLGVSVRNGDEAPGA